MKRLITVLTVLSIPSLPATYGQQCNERGFYCVNSTSVQLCVDDGPPIGDIFPCPSPLVCGIRCSLECADPDDPCTLTTTTVATTTDPPFTCSESGRFPDVNNCSNYWICSEVSTGGFIQYQYTCPGNSRFNSITKKCSLGSVVCAGSSTTTPNEELTTPGGFKCKASGRFPDPLDNKSYYICSPSSTGTYIENHYTCPGASIYNPTSNKCVLPTL